MYWVSDGAMWALQHLDDFGNMLIALVAWLGRTLICDNFENVSRKVHTTRVDCVEVCDRRREPWASELF